MATAIHIEALDLKRIAEIIAFQNNQKHVAPKSSRKRPYNSLEIDDAVKDEQDDDVSLPQLDSAASKAKTGPEFITIADRCFSGSITSEADSSDLSLLAGAGSEISLRVRDVVLEIQHDTGSIRVCSIPKAKLSKMLLLEFKTSCKDLTRFKNEIAFFKPLRFYDRSSYVHLVEPFIDVVIGAGDQQHYIAKLEIKYQIRIQECCLFVHPTASTNLISKLVNSIASWRPVKYETPYSEKEITKKGFNKLTPSTFYNAVSDIGSIDRSHELGQPLIIPELDTELFTFQTKTVNWLLRKEGVHYDDQTKSVIEDEFFPSSERNNENKIAECLDLISFGWSRIELPDFASNVRKGPFYWFNQYTGNLASSEFVFDFLSKEPRPPAQGLLAEEMGLGKTVEILALILLNRRRAQDVGSLLWDPLAERNILRTKTTLIICPDSILKQWYQEISMLAPNLKISIYKGIYTYNRSNLNDMHAKNYKTSLQIAKTLSNFDVVLTSYAVVSREIHHALYNPSIRPKRKCARISRDRIASAIREKDEDGNEVEDKSSKREEEEQKDYEERNDHSSPLVLLQFWRIVLDEVQMVSSKISNSARIAKIIPRYHSWGVSGTPIRKDVNDLHSFLAFLHLYPFSDDLPSPKANSRLWTNFMNESSPYMHFLRLFKNISLRHTKRMVSDEIRLPPQKRVLFTTEFTPVERNLYDHMFEEFLSTVSLNSKGDPLVANWEPNNTILSYMREWLIKLRQTCCHSHLGTGAIVRRAANGNEDMHLRTVDAVLDLAIQSNENSIVANERKKLMLMIDKGQVYEVFQHPESALDVWEKCLPIVNNRIAILKKESQIWEAEIKKKSNEKISKEESQNLAERASQAKMRIRSWLEILHRLYFFIASSHYQIYTPPTADVARVPEKGEEISDEELSPEALKHRKLEVEYYDKAELLRRELLSESIGRVTKAVKQVTSSNLSQYNIPFIAPRESKVIGMEATLFLSKYKDLANELNKQAKVLNAWFGELTELLSKLLQDDTNGETNPNEDEYEESLLDQDKAFAYLDVLQKALKERYDAILGANEKSAVTSLNNREDDKDDVLILRPGTGKSDFHKELESQRREARPISALQPELSLRSMIARSKDILENMDGNVPTTLEYKLFTALVAELKTTLDSQKKVLSKVKSEYFQQLNDLYNVRIEYYKSLQALSDSVRAVDMSDLDTRSSWRFGPDERDRVEHIDRKLQDLETTIRASTIRTKYLRSLKNIDSWENDEDRFCIICQSSIIAGVLTACGHQYCKECLDEWFKQNRRNCPMCKSHLNSDSVYNFTYTRANLKASLVTSEESVPHEDASKFIHSIYEPIDVKIVKQISEVSIFKSYGSKIDLIIKMVKYLIDTEKNVQIVVFSQWSELLYLIGAALKYNDIDYLNSSDTLSFNLGSGKRGNKITDVETFKKNKHITCFLLNAKAQASGLTLVNASHVFLCEPLVNTALELQAISRIHRIGQKKPTTVWMFAIGNTVEESIVKLSTKKRLEYLNETKKHEAEDDDEMRRSQGNEEVLNAADEITSGISNINEKEIEVVNTAELTKTVEGLVDKKLYGGELVPNDDLWSSFFS